MALTLHTPDLTSLFPATLDDPASYSQYYFGGGVAVISILVYNMGDFFGNFVSAGIAIAMAFCGLSSIAAAGRMLGAVGRAAQGMNEDVARRVGNYLLSADPDASPRPSTQPAGEVRTKDSSSPA